MIRVIFYIIATIVLIFSVIFLGNFPQFFADQHQSDFFWWIMGYLTIGNLFIGTVEGVILKSIFKAPGIKIIIAVIVANYFGSWFALFVIRGHQNIQLLNGSTELFCLECVGFCITFFINIYGVFRGLSGIKNHVTLSIRGGLIVTLMTQSLIFAGTSIVENRSLLDIDAVPLSEITIPSHLVIYYQKKENGLITALDLKKDIEIDLKEVVSMREISQQVATPQDLTLYRSPEMLYISTQSVGDADRSGWSISIDNRDHFGLILKNGHKRRHIAFNTIFVQRPVQEGIHLPGGFVLFQMGYNDRSGTEILLYDINQNRIAPVARGTLFGVIVKGLNY